MLLDFTKLSVLRVDIPVSKYMKKVLDNFPAQRKNGKSPIIR